jgi:hypothetical protein
VQELHLEVDAPQGRGVEPLVAVARGRQPHVVNLPIGVVRGAVALDAASPRAFKDRLAPLGRRRQTARGLAPGLGCDALPGPVAGAPSPPPPS